MTQQNKKATEVGTKKEKVMTNQQFEAFLQLLLATVKRCKTIDEVIAEIEKLL